MAVFKSDRISFPVPSRQESPPTGAKFAWRVTNVSFDPASGAVREWLTMDASYGLEGSQLQLRMNAAGLAERGASDAFLGSVEVEVSPTYHPP